MLNAVAQLAEQNPDYSGALDELLSLLHRIAIVQAAPAVLDQAPDERERLQELAGNMTAEDVQLYYQIGLNSQRDLSFAPDMRAGFEMALLRMLAFKPQGIVSGGEKKKTELSKPAVAAIQPIAKPITAKPITATPTLIATKPIEKPVVAAPVSISPPPATHRQAMRQIAQGLGTGCSLENSRAAGLRRGCGSRDGWVECAWMGFE